MWGKISKTEILKYEVTHANQEGLGVCLSEKIKGRKGGKFHNLCVMGVCFLHILLEAFCSGQGC